MSNYQNNVNSSKKMMLLYWTTRSNQNTRGAHFEYYEQCFRSLLNQAVFSLVLHVEIFCASDYLSHDSMQSWIR